MWTLALHEIKGRSRCCMSRDKAEVWRSDSSIRQTGRLSFHFAQRRRLVFQIKDITSLDSFSAKILYFPIAP